MIDERAAKRVLALQVVVVFFAVTAGNMVNVALPTIGADFGVSEGTYGWIVTGYMLTFAVFSAIHGRLADRVGARRLYLAGILVFGFGSALTAALPNIESIIAVRMLQGAGAAGLPSIGTLIIARVFPPEKRGAASGVLLAGLGVAASIGPFLGGALVQAFRWQAVFLFSSVSLVTFPFAARLLPRELDARGHTTIDWVGAALMTVGASLLIYSFDLLAHREFGLKLIALLAAGVLALVGLAVWIRRVSIPFIHPEVFADVRYSAAVAVGFLNQATRMGTVVLVPILLHDVDGLAPIWVGAVLLPGALLIAALSPITGRLSDRVGARKLVLGASVCMIIGDLVMATTTGASVVGVTIGMTIFGLGFSFLHSPLLGAVTKILPPRHAGIGLGMFMTIFLLGAAFGIATSITALELQADDAPSWLGLSLGGGAPFSNATLVLSALSLLGLLLVPWLSGKDPRPPGE